MSYLIPQAPVESETIVKKSRFITCIDRARNRDEAIAFINKIKDLHPEARHHCWAYIAGHPTATTDIAMSDDGEPQGTAGKPILNVLQHKQVGEVALVVVRYFGGIKLGAGGLVRAYSGAANQGMEVLATTLLVKTTEIKMTFDYNLETKVKHILEEESIPIIRADYAERITFVAEADALIVEDLETLLFDKTSGRIHFS